MSPTTVLRLNDYRRKPKRIFFSRSELNQLLSLYSRQVARGEWRDYAIDQRDGAVLFSVFRHTHESPVYTVIKAAPGSCRQGDYTVLQGRHRLASGMALVEVLAWLRGTQGPTAVPLEGEGGR